MAVLVAAFNLRAAVTSVGPLLRDIQAATGMSAIAAGILTSAPPLCFGVFGLLAGRLGRRFGVALALTCGLASLVGGLLLRVVTGSPVVIILASLLALGGIALVNVLIPVVVKEWFEPQLGRMTGLYAMSLAVGTAAAAALTVPIADATGSWRVGLGFWALPALLALILWGWVTSVHRDHPARPDEEVPGAGAPTPVHRSRQAWGLTVFFGLQALAFYSVMGWLPSILQDSGISATRAGLLLALTTAISAPIAAFLPVLAGRRPDQRPWVLGLGAVSGSAYLGLLLAPTAAPVVWSALLGLGLGAFPLALLLIALRAATGPGASRLSSLAQGVGYLLAAAGPFVIGALHDLRGGWDLPLSLLLLLLVPQTLAGLVAARPGHVDRVTRTDT